ncbi:lysostaphin resistance A-like protein [Halobacillus sp. H74]|uniref:CPBP family intramembrane glutamic endopeptidase n=1 Tax=Halobacillus sp. H74 TaxID=3457436 RepID=UPI003FCCF8D8
MNTNSGLHKIKIWKLLLWLLLWIIGGGVIFTLMQAPLSYLFHIYVYAGAGLWLYTQFKKYNISFSHLTSKDAVSIPALVKTFGVVTIIKAASFASVLVLWNIIGLISPSFLSGITGEIMQTSNNQESLGSIFIYFVLVVMIAPSIEELLFRGVLLNNWCKRLGTFAGVILVSLTFAIFHGPSGFLSALLASIFFSILYLKTKSIWIPMAAHSFSNLLSFLIQYVPFQNGTASVDDHTKSLQLMKSLGMYSGVALLVILLFLLVIFYKMYPRRSHLPYRFY